LLKKVSNEMGGKVNSTAVLNELQRSMALKESGAKRPFDSGKRHPGCEGHGCSAACGYHGYCDYEATRYYTDKEGQTNSEDTKGARHSYYRREMRL
jgi:hypothetical protein